MLRARTLPPFVTHLLSASALLLATFTWIGCDSSDSGMNADQPLRQVSYDLSAQSNDGALSDGVSATATFQELPDNQTLVTLELDNTTDAGVTHPAHIHRSSDGGIEIRLSPIDGTNQKGITSARVVNRSFEQLVDFNGYINIHESAAKISNVVAQGDIGANADVQTSEGLNVINSPDSKTYSLSANSNDGSVASNGIPGTVQITELTGSLTLVQVSLDPGTENGATGASVSHPAHIHRSSDGGIEYYLSPVSGLDPNARSGKLVDASYNTLVDFNGYVNVHQSAAKLNNVVAQGDIGANASGGDDGGGGGGGDGGY